MSQPLFTLPDPRQYHPQVSLTNMLIHNALSVQNASSDADRELWFVAIRDAMAQMLERGELLSISVALAMVPSQDTYKIVWDALRAAVEQPEGRRAIVFAVPLVLVAGSKGQATLPAAIADEEGLNALLREHGILGAAQQVRVFGQLLHPDTVVAMDAARLFRLTRDLASAEQGIGEDLNGAAITLKEEGVFLRYLLGVAVQGEGEAEPVKLGGAVGAWGMPLMKFLGEQLHTDGVTLFPIARPPLPVMQALVAGNFARFEVALQVFASSQIRRLRELSKDPVAILSAHANGELHITLSAEGDERNWEAFVWPLAAMDNVTLIESNFRELMAECRVRDVHVLSQVYPESRDGIPLFFTADDLPQTDSLQ